jgi:hypothetical protein
MPPLSESDTRAELIDPIIRAKGWVYPYVKREESGKAVEVVNGQPRQRNTVFVDYLLRVEANAATQPVAVALIKPSRATPDYGLEQAKAYTKCRRFNIPFFIRPTPPVRRIRPLHRPHQPPARWPTSPRAGLRRYAESRFQRDDPVARPLITLTPAVKPPSLLPGCRHPRRAGEGRPCEIRRAPAHFALLATGTARLSSL